MSAHNAVVFIAELEYIAENGPRSELLGLCSSLANALVADGTDDDSLASLRIDLHQAFKSWPDYSGDEDYPVPSDIPGDSACNAYCRKHIWDGEYGEKRMSLVRHCLQWFKDAYNV